MESPKDHKAGFVNILGKPNVGKSTLMNRLVGEKLSIITSKAQTTRHRIMGILNGDDFQIIYSDTPGILKPEYELHKSMMRSVRVSVEDADVLLFLVEAGEKFDETLHLPVLKNCEGRIILLINKIDKLKNKKEVEAIHKQWSDTYPYDSIIPISALHNTNIDTVYQTILENLPLHPPYFPKDQLTDKPERFFASEIIREKIFLLYKKEIPYSTEVVITDFKEDEEIIRIRAEIFVERNSQKGIIIGKGGSSLKTVGVEARKDMEDFFGKQVYLETYVKVEKNWRKDTKRLSRFGY